MEKEIDWQVNKSILECNKYLLEKRVNYDVSFKVGELQEVIEAHKFILSTRSPVFDRMFNGSFCESETDPVIPDVSPVAFRTVLRYCYYECLDIKGDVSLSVLYAATKYMLPILERAAKKTLVKTLDHSKIWDVCKYSTEVGDDELHTGCITYLKSSLCSSNLLNVFKYAVTTGHEELHAWCRKHFKVSLSETNILDVTRYVATIRDDKLHATCNSYLKKHLSRSNIWEVYKYALEKGDTEVHQNCREYFERDVVMVREALQSDEFPNIEYEVLLDLLHINDKVDETVGIGHTPGISISEIELFTACNVWAEADCLRKNTHPTGNNKRSVLGECLSLIRFPIMLQKDLITVVYPTGILTQAGIVNLGNYIGRDPGTECQVDFPSHNKQFVVTLLGSATRAYLKNTVFIESEVRVMLSRLWMWWLGSYAVSVRDEKSQKCWTTVVDAKHENHMSNASSNDILHYIDIEPQVLEAGTRYAVTAECRDGFKPIKKQPAVNYIMVPGILHHYKEVKVTQDHKTNNIIYGLSMSLV